ncbi:MAG TPA: hypothetical protein VFG15_12515 [Amycolatopsis sp.]|nr:hypothetical protein [Amycolatopsis sp.]
MPKTVEPALNLKSNSRITPWSRPSAEYSPRLLDGIGLVGALAVFGGLYLIAGTFPAIFRVWRGLDDPASIGGDRPVSQGTRTD